MPLNRAPPCPLCQHPLADLFPLLCVFSACVCLCAIWESVDTGAVASAPPIFPLWMYIYSSHPPFLDTSSFLSKENWLPLRQRVNDFPHKTYITGRPPCHDEGPPHFLCINQTALNSSESPGPEKESPERLWNDI